MSVFRGNEDTLLILNANGLETGAEQCLRAVSRTDRAEAGTGLDARRIWQDLVEEHDSGLMRTGRLGRKHHLLEECGWIIRQVGDYYWVRF